MPAEIIVRYLHKKYYMIKLTLQDDKISTEKKESSKKCNKIYFENSISQKMANYLVIILQHPA